MEYIVDVIEEVLHHFIVEADSKKDAIQKFWKYQEANSGILISENAQQLDVKLDWIEKK